MKDFRGYIKIIVLCLIVLNSNITTALETGSREVSKFQKEALRCAKEIFKVNGEFDSNEYVVTLQNHKIHDFRVEEASISFLDTAQKDLDKFIAGDFSFEELRIGTKIVVNFAEISAEEIDSLIKREIARVSSRKRIFDTVETRFRDGSINISGKIDLTKVPGNPFSMIPQDMSVFDITVSVKSANSRIYLEIIEGKMNEQVISDELKAMLLNWLNPLWDFSKMPYRAGFHNIKIKNSGVEFRGFLF